MTPTSTSRRFREVKAEIRKLKRDFNIMVAAVIAAIFLVFALTYRGW